MISVAFGLATAPAPAQDDGFGPVGSEVRVNQYTSYGQDDGYVALDDEGNAVIVFSTLGDIGGRIFNADGSARTDEFRVNTAVTAGLQDFPIAAWRPDGEAFVVVWNDWHGNDGFNMGCFGRLFDKNGVAITPEVRINEYWDESQFDPCVAVHVDGTFVVAWVDAGRDGIAGIYMRRFAPDFTPLTGDVLVNLPSSRSQVDPWIARDHRGHFVITFTDASGDYGEPRNVLAKVFNADGTVFTEQFRVHQYVAGRQRAPCVAMAATGRWMVVWQDESAQDGSGFGVFARLFEIDGTPVTDDIPVPDYTVGDQWNPAIGCDGAGNFIVVWEHLSGEQADVMMRRYDRNGFSLTAAERVNATETGYQGWPYVAFDDSGQDIVFAFTGGDDVWMRRYRTSPLVIAGDRSPGSSPSLELCLVGEEGHAYVIGASLDTDPGLELGDGRIWHLEPDVLFRFALSHPNSGPLHQFQGLLAEGGRGTGGIDIPPDPGFSGKTFYFAAGTVGAAVGFGTAVIRLTEPIALNIP
ncbi:MAG: hypothetical protein AB1486_26325 [Planctomycetota bacterium]